MGPAELALAKAGIGIGGDLLSGFIGGANTQSIGDELIRAQKQQQAYLDKSYKDARGMYDPIYKKGMQGFDALSSGVLSGEFARPDLPEFQYDKTAMDFLDPSREFQQQELLRGLEGSQAFGGKLKSGASMEALQDRFQDRAMTDFSNAHNRMTGDRNFSYQDYTNQFNNTVAQVNDKYNKLSSLADKGVGATNTLANLRMGQGQSQANTASAIGDINAQTGQVPYMNMQNIVGAGQNLGGALLGAYGSGTPEVDPNRADQTGQMGMSDFNQNSINQFQQRQSNPYGLLTNPANLVPTGNLGSTPSTPSTPFQGWGNTPSHSWGK